MSLAASGLRVRLGEQNLAVQEGPEQDRVVASAILHPNYNRFTLDSDLMLLKLARPVNIGRTVRPVTLPSACATTGTTCLVSGWGTVTSPQGKAGEEPGTSVGNDSRGLSQPSVNQE